MVNDLMLFKDCEAFICLTPWLSRQWLLVPWLSVPLYLSFSMLRSCHLDPKIHLISKNLNTYLPRTSLLNHGDVNIYIWYSYLIIQWIPKFVHNSPSKHALPPHNRISTFCKTTESAVKKLKAWSLSAKDYKSRCAPLIYKYLQVYSYKFWKVNYRKMEMFQYNHMWPTLYCSLIYDL